MSEDATGPAAVPTLEALRAERDQAEEHVARTDRQGGCQRSMFLGDCLECERYFALDDQVRVIELANA